MDTFQILSNVRDYSGLNNDDVGDPLLQMYINTGYKNVCQVLYPLFRQHLIKTRDILAQSGLNVTMPSDALTLLNVWREKTAAADDYKIGQEVDIEQKGNIGRINYPLDAEYPLYINEGRTLVVYPTMTTLDVRVQYRKRMVDLLFGKVALVDSVSITLNRFALPEDDLYNDYYLHLYDLVANDYVYNGAYLISDYVGSTKIATVSPSCSLSGSTYFALEPILPSEYHNLIVDAAIIELEKSTSLQRRKLVKGEYAKKTDELNNRFDIILGVEGLLNRGN